MENNLKIKVIGVGGSGISVITNMKENGIKNVELISIDTNKNNLDEVNGEPEIIGINDGLICMRPTKKEAKADLKILIGEKLRRGSFYDLYYRRYTFRFYEIFK